MYGSILAIYQHLCREFLLCIGSTSASAYILAISSETIRWFLLVVFASIDRRMRTDLAFDNEKLQICTRFHVFCNRDICRPVDFFEGEPADTSCNFAGLRFYDLHLGQRIWVPIISLMTASRDGIRFKSFVELFGSNLSFVVCDIFMNKFNNSKDYRLFKRMEPIDENFLFHHVVWLNKAIITTCKQLHQHYFVGSSHDPALYFYLLPNQIMKFNEVLYLATASPFYDL